MKKWQDRIWSQPASAYAPGYVAPLGQFCMEINTGKGKYGDGVTPWSSLAYAIGNTTAAGAASWGNITGTLSQQDDLQAALNAKPDTSALAAVAISGAFADLTGKPSLGSAASTASSTWALAASSYVYAAQLAAVATSGAYAALTGTPALGTAASTAASNFASSTHAHDASQVTSGVFNAALIPYPNLSFASSFAGPTIALGTNTYSTCAAISLGAGTWQVWGQALCGRNVASTVIFTTRISDGTNSFGSGQAQIAAVVSTYTLISIDTLLTLGATSTISYQAAATVSSCFVRAQAWQNNAGSTATFIMATRIK